jgi:hypothetical protein
MTWASQAYNPGSNPGDRIFYASSQVHKNNKQEQIQELISKRKKMKKIATMFQCGTSIIKDQQSHS